MIDVKRPIKTKFPGYYIAPIDEFVELSKSGAVACYLYSSNILSNGELYQFIKDNKKVRLLNKDGVTYTPIELFSRFLDVSVMLSDDKITLSYKQKSMTLEENVELGYFRDRGNVFVPILTVADTLGLPYGVYHKDRLFVFADDCILSKIKNDFMLMRGACYAVFGKYNTEKLTHEDFVIAKDKWRKKLVGSSEINDLSDPDVREKIDSVSKSCEVAWNGLHKENGAVALFGEKAPSESSDLLVQYSNIWKLCAGFATCGSKFYRNEELKKDILYAYEWMYENMYGESVIEGRGWRDPHLFNWWEWMTGAIESMTDGLLVMEEFIDKKTLAKYFRCYDYVSTFLRVEYREDMAASRLKVGTKVALLLEDKERLFYRFLDYDLRFDPLSPQKGKYSDHVCWTHNFPYNMGYGLGHMHRTMYVTSAIIDTPVEYTSPDFYDLFLTVKYMYDTAMYRGRGFAEFRGRMFGTEKIAGAKALAGIVSMIGAFGEEEDNYLKKMIKIACTDLEVRKMLISASSLCDLAVIKAILSDDSISDTNDKELSHSWFTADRFAQHRNDYAFFLAMSSSRHMSYESINSAHKTGWYTGDGALYLYTPADDKSYDYEAFLSNINICYRIPGVTADDQERRVWSHSKGWIPSKSFTGSMDFDKKYGIGAFDYEPYHYEGHEADGTTDDGYGGIYVFHENDLTAKKSYHFFDKECVCLGAGICSTMNSNVSTTVEHRRLVPGADIITVNGKSMEGEFEERKASPFHVTLKGVAGYVFPEGNNVRISRYKYDPAGCFRDEYTVNTKIDPQNYFEIDVEHGINPQNEGYSYFILPLSDPDATREYAENPEVEILSNSPKLQAVRKSSLGITSTAFYEAGSLGDVTVSVPCLLMYKDIDGTFDISICDPTQKLSTGEITLFGKYELIEKAEELTASIFDDKAIIKADFTNLAGKNLVARFKRV